jgi:tetratricopeptide (TPR) repeat protein
MLAACTNVWGQCDEKLFDQCLSQLNQSNYPQAAECFSDITIFCPSDTRAKLLLGRARLMTGTIQQARAVLSEYLDKEPRDVEGYLWLGQAEYMIGNRFEGERLLKKALSMAPGNRILGALVTRIEAENRDLLKAETEQKKLAILGKVNEAIGRAAASFRRTLTPEELMDKAREQAREHLDEKRGVHWRQGQRLDIAPLDR